MPPKAKKQEKITKKPLARIQSAKKLFKNRQARSSISKKSIKLMKLEEKVKKETMEREEIKMLKARLPKSKTRSHWRP